MTLLLVAVFLGLVLINDNLLCLVLLVVWMIGYNGWTPNIF